MQCCGVPCPALTDSLPILPYHAIPPFPARTPPVVRESAVPGAAHNSVPVGMASASLLSPSLRRRGLRTVRHGPETAGRAAFPDGTRNGSSPSSVRRCLLLAFLCGFTGHFQQHADFTIRNAIYGQLIAEPWPLVMPDGHHFIYYLGHWLPPACAASFCPAAYAPWLLTGWTFLGLELALLTAACRWGIRKTAWWAPASPLSRFARRVAELPGHALLVPVSGIPRPNSLVHRHSIPNIQHIQPCRSGTSVFGPGPDAFPCPPSGYYLMGALLLPGSPPGGPDSAPLHSA